jgi:hypothetical protein
MGKKKLWFSCKLSLKKKNMLDGSRLQATTLKNGDVLSQIQFDITYQPYKS